MSKTTKRRTLINIETHEMTIIRSNRDRKKQYCEVCRTTVWAFTFDRLAELLHQSPGEIRGRIHEEKMHLVDAAADPGLICGISLEKRIT